MLDFCNSLFYSLPHHQTRQLQIIQNAAAKLITGAKKLDSNADQLKQLHWLPISHRITFKLAVLGFKFYHSQTPRYLSKLNIAEPSRSTRSSSLPHFNLSDIKLKTLRKYGDRCYFKSIPSVFNALPPQIRSSCNLATFKSRLKTYLFSDAHK